MYRSIIRQFKIVPRGKDPKEFFLKMVEYFTETRFTQKNKFKETGDKYYDDLQAASKIFINSSYGTLGTPGLHFNDFGMADKITGIGRQIIRKSIRHVVGKDINEYDEFLPNPYNLEKDAKYEGLI